MKGTGLEGGKCAASTVGGQNLRGAVVTWRTGNRPARDLRWLARQPFRGASTGMKAGAGIGPGEEQQRPEQQKHKADGQQRADWQEQ